MKPAKLLSILAAICVSGAVNAAVYTVEPMLYAVGVDVSTASPGVTLTRLVNLPGTVGYAPTLQPALIDRCGLYGVCSDITTMGLISAGTDNLTDYRDCYNLSRRGVFTWSCGFGWSGLQAVFSAPTDFVEFQLTWWIDPPMLLAYDAAGNEILSCNPGWGPMMSSCFSSYFEADSWAYFGTIRVRATAGRIARVVVGSALGSAKVTQLQYSIVKP